MLPEVEVSNRGRLRCARTGNAVPPILFEGRPWVPKPGAAGGREMPLGRAVFSAHCGPIPDGHEVHHRDGDPLNNDVANLEALTPREHRRLHQGPSRRRAFKPKHPEREVAHACFLLELGHSTEEVARRTGLPPRTLRHYRDGDRRASITRAFDDSIFELKENARMAGLDGWEVFAHG